ncbi:TPA: hypothetical protein RY389_004916 [Escherichia albertii]|nr:hypothetical protein [Escherichia albertii]
MKEIKIAAHQCVLPARIRFTFSTSGEIKEEVIEKMRIVIDQLSKDEVHLDPYVHLESYLSGVNISCSPA